MPKEEGTPRDQTPSSETVRLPLYLMEWARFVCFHRKGPNNRRLKLTQYLEAKLKEVVREDYEAVKRELAGQEGERPRSRKKDADR